MRPLLPWGFIVLFASLFLLACSGQKQPSASPGAATAVPATTVPVAQVSPSPAPLPAPTPVPQPPEKLVASHLSIPTLGIDVDVQSSATVPDTSVPPPGCPSLPPSDTQVVPNHGVATPSKPLDGFDNKAWIFGHSRWQGVPGVFNALQNLTIGAEVFVDGMDAGTGMPVAHQRFVVDGIYLTDIASGGVLLGDESSPVPSKPTVYLQTSVREDGAGKQWIFDQSRLLAKATNLVEGNLDDPCKYLLLFVTGTAS